MSRPFAELREAMSPERRERNATESSRLKDELLLRIGDVVQHRRTGLIGRVSGFAHDGTIDVMVNHTGPYPQSDFIKLVPQADDGGAQ